MMDPGVARWVTSLRSDRAGERTSEFLGGDLRAQPEMGRRGKTSLKLGCCFVEMFPYSQSGYVAGCNAYALLCTSESTYRRTNLLFGQMWLS